MKCKKFKKKNKKKNIEKKKNLMVKKKSYGIFNDVSFSRRTNEHLHCITMICGNLGKFELETFVFIHETLA